MDKVKLVINKILKDKWFMKQKRGKRIRINFISMD